MLRSRLFTASAAVCALAAFPAVGTAATPNTWRAGPSMSLPRLFPSLATLADGRVLFVGGVLNVPGGEAVDAYSPQTNSFSAVAAMHQNRSGPLAVSLTDGRVLAAGGAGAGDTSGEIYDPAADTWTAIPSPMHAMRSSGLLTNTAAAAVSLPGGEALLVGGEATGPGGPTAGADIFDPSLNGGVGGFSAAADMSTPRLGAGAAALPGGDVLVVGGSDAASEALATGEVYHSSSNTWTPVANQMATAHVQPSVVPLPNGNVLVFGGVASAVSSPSLATTTDSEIYDPATNRFTPTGPTIHSIVLPSTAALPDGRVVAAGGESLIEGNAAFGQTQVYEPTVNAWVRGASPLGLTLQAGAALPSGEVLATRIDTVLSGTGTQIYTPATVPGAPTEVAAQARNGAAVVTWAPAADNGRPITHYTVRASNGTTVTTADGREQATIPVPGGASVSFTVTATNDLGTGPSSAPTAAVTPTATGPVDKTPPTVKVSGLKTRLKLKSFLKGVTATVTTSEPASLSLHLYASARRATLARVDNVVLASKSYRRALVRHIRLRPGRRLFGHARRFSVRLRISAHDAAGNLRTVTKTIKVVR
jgi:Kelch motif